MYIRVKEVKTMYQLYLCHSKRINGKSKKLLNKYLCSINRDEIEGVGDDNEAKAAVIEQVMDKVRKNIGEIPQHICDELKDEFKKVGNLFFDKIDELASIED